jgi:hypothetical protein
MGIYPPGTDVGKLTRPADGHPIGRRIGRDVIGVEGAGEAVDLEAGRSTSAAICERWFVAPPTASKYVRRARDRGYLGPAARGKASA